MTGAMGNIFKRLSDRQLVAPYLENAFAADKWPDSYTITVDSLPYYGLTDTDGITHDVGTGDGYFHAASHALMPARELYYRFHPLDAKHVEPERRTFKNHVSMSVGSALHATVQAQLDMAGILKPCDDFEWHPTGEEGQYRRWCKEAPAEWEYRDEVRKCRGRIDGILNHPAEGEMIFEYKSMNSRTYRFTDVALPEWIAQTNLGMDHYGVDEAVVLVQELGLPWDMKEFRVQRRSAILEPIYERWEYVLECIRRDTPPPCSHPLGSGLAARCAVSHLCWPML